MPKRAGDKQVCKTDGGATAATIQVSGVSRRVRRPGPMRARARMNPGREAVWSSCWAVCVGTRCSRNVLSVLRRSCLMARRGYWRAYQPDSAEPATPEGGTAPCCTPRRMAVCRCAQGGSNCTSAATVCCASRGLQFKHARSPHHPAVGDSRWLDTISARCWHCLPNIVVPSVLDDAHRHEMRRHRTLAACKRADESKHSLEQQRLTPARASIYAGSGCSAQQLRRR